jgi:ribosome-binding ATPase YchF (GTP1/OBG family)
MSYKIGLVGLPNVGKSSLFTFFTKKKAFIANFPFATIDPSIGLIAMTDNRLKELNDYWRSNKVTT